jgi:hypothetical protein
VTRVEVDLDGVSMTVTRQMRLQHASDFPNGREECFGGDTMGHWNVARINRILDACYAPIVQLPMPADVILGLARVGKPDLRRARQHAERGLATMPPLSFVSFVDADDVVQCLLVDGHHRMMALHFLDVAAVPARVLPPALADDVRIVEMTETALMPGIGKALRRHTIEGLAA